MLNPDNKLGVWPSVLCALWRKESDIITISLGVSEKYGRGDYFIFPIRPPFFFFYLIQSVGYVAFCKHGLY